MSGLREELERAQAERDRLDVVIAYLKDRLAEQPAAAARTNGGARIRKGRLTAAAAAERALAEHGGPMRTPDLLVKVQELGAQMKDPDSLYKTLGRSPRFTRVGRGLWTLTERSDT